MQKFNPAYDLKEIKTGQFKLGSIFEIFVCGKKESARLALSLAQVLNI
jgi:hypothetical protein